MAVAGAIEGTTADLVVIGSGAAGLTGALVAALGGARVTLLEKTDLIGGTTAISGGGAWVPCNPVMQEIGLHDSREDALTYLRACTGGRAEDDMLEAMVDRGADMVRALQDAGIPWQAWPATGGAIDYRGWLPGAMRGGRTLEVMGISLSELGAWADKVRVAPELRSSQNKLEYYRQSMHLARPGSESGHRRWPHPTRPRSTPTGGAPRSSLASSRSASPAGWWCTWTLRRSSCCRRRAASSG